MTLRAFEVTGRRRNPESTSATDFREDFELKEAGAAPEIGHLADPRVSLYSLDRGRGSVAFVDGADVETLLAAPFSYMAQRQHARRVITLDLETFCRIPRPPVPPGRLVQLYSVGRAGSTVLHHALNQAPGMVSWSEPDVFYQVATAVRAGTVGTGEAVRILAAAVQHYWQTRPAGCDTLVIKHRGRGIWGSRELLQACPDAGIVFLYRDPVATIHSFDRAMGSPIGRRQWLLGLPVVGRLLRPDVGHLLDDWIDKVNCYLDLRALAPGSVALRYETMIADPVAQLEALLAALGIDRPDPGRVRQVFARDSQEGTALSRAANRGFPFHPRTILHIRNRLARQSRIPPDLVLPGTLSTQETRARSAG